MAAPATMLAVTHERYGSPAELALTRLETPTATGDQVLVSVKASSANAGDWFLLTGRPWLMRLATGLFRPKRRVFGQDMAGVVVAVGERVTRFSVGDEVYGEVPGALAEFIAVPARLLAHKPRALTFEDAAALPIAAGTAFVAMHDLAQVKPGHRVLINGASGGVGSFAIQIAKALGAEVTAVCSTRNLERARALGADHLVDYTRDDFTQTNTRFDAILDLAGSKPIRACLRLLSPTGVYLPSVGSALWPLKAAALSLLHRGRIKVFVAGPNAERLAALNKLVEAGLVRPLIDRRFELSEYREWMAHQGAGHAQGKSTLRLY